ncbi:hypothetical protein Tco_0450964 [Tanacetum coccineum]
MIQPEPEGSTQGNFPLDRVEVLEHQSDTFVVFTVKMEILLEPTSIKLLSLPVNEKRLVAAAKPVQGDSFGILK